MDNVCHTLCGLALARAGAGRIGRHATAALLIGANLPDLDGIAGLFDGKAGYLCHHRGITHALPGLAVEAVALGGLLYAFGRWLGRDVRLGALILAAAVGLLSHLGLDALNTYGVRPFLPFDGTWYYGDCAFIVDPWLWLAFAAAACLGAVQRRRAGTIAWWTFAALATWMLVATDRAPSAVALLWPLWMAAALLARRFGTNALRGESCARWLLAIAVVYLIGLNAASRTAEVRGLALLRDALDGATVHATSCHPRPAVPWRFTVMAQTEHAIVVLPDVDLLAGTHGAVTRTPQNLDDPALDAVRDTTEYRVWRSFARHPFTCRHDDRLILGDRRYSRPDLPDSWCNLAVPLEPRRSGR